MSESVAKSREELEEYFTAVHKYFSIGEEDWSVDLTVSIWVSPNIGWEQERAYLKECAILITQRSSLSSLETESELKHTCGKWLERQIIERRISLTEKPNWRKIDRDD